MFQAWTFCSHTPVCSVGHHASDDDGSLGKHSSWDHVGVRHRLKTHSGTKTVNRTRKLKLYSSTAPNGKQLVTQYITLYFKSVILFTLVVTPKTTRGLADTFNTGSATAK